MPTHKAFVYATWSNPHATVKGVPLELLNGLFPKQKKKTYVKTIKLDKRKLAINLISIELCMKSLKWHDAFFWFLSLLSEEYNFPCQYLHAKIIIL
jgi:hypothetical protein